MHYVARWFEAIYTRTWLCQKTTSEVCACRARLLDELLNSYGFQPVWPLTPWYLQSIFLHTTAAHWIVSLFGRICCGYDVVANSSRSAAVCGPVPPAFPLAAATTFTTIKVLKRPFFTCLVLTQHYSKFVSATVSAIIKWLYLDNSHKLCWCSSLRIKSSAWSSHSQAGVMGGHPSTLHKKQQCIKWRYGTQKYISSAFSLNMVSNT